MTILLERFLSNPISGVTSRRASGEAGAATHSGGASFPRRRMIPLGCACLVMLAALGGPASLLAESPRPKDFGRQWVRTHPFTLMALVQQNEAVAGKDHYAQAGFSVMLVWKERAGIFKAAKRMDLPWIYHLEKRYRTLDDIKAEVSGLVKTYPGGLGFLAWDEPKLPEMPRAGKRVAWINKTYPEMLVFSTVNPIKPPFAFSFPNLAGEKAIDTGLYDEPSVPYTYDDHLDNLAEIVQSDVLMADIYPFWNPKKLYPDKYLRDQYFFMLQALRKAGLKHNRPYWIFVQAYEDPGRCRLPSESDLRMEVYSALAFGFTGVSYFLYDAGPPFRCLMDQSNSPTPLYHVVRELNAEVARLGRSLRFLTCTDVRYVPGSRQQDGKTVTNPVPRAPWPHFTRGPEWPGIFEP